MPKPFASIEVCASCGAVATHFCGACGRWLCDDPICKAKSAVRAIVRHPVRSSQVIGRKILRL